MRTMFDSIRAANIPADAQMVAGYVDEYTIPKWTAAEWQRFSRAVKVRIVKKASTNDGHVLDVEPRLATPEQAPGWVAMRRRAGLATPVIYCNASTWPTVQAAFRQQGVAQPLYWIAHYDGRVELPELDGIRAIAKQHTGDTNGYDLSCVADHWPGVDNPEENDMELSDTFTTKWNKPLRVDDYMKWSDYRLVKAVQKINAVQQSVGKLTTLLARQDGVTADDIAAALRPGLVADLEPVLADVMRGALGDDNADQAETIADQVIDQLGAKLNEED